MADKDITNRQLLNALTQQLGVIADNMVTKQNLDDRLKDFATRDDLNALEGRMDTKFATKDDLNALEGRMNTKFATKDDFQALKDDFKRLERKIDSSKQASLNHHLEVRKDIGDLNKQFGKLREGLAQAAA